MDDKSFSGQIKSNFYKYELFIINLNFLQHKEEQQV